MKNEVTPASLAGGLRALGVQKGMALEVHCSLGSLGYVVGGPQAVIQALLDAVGSEGSIVMPSFRLSRADPLTADDRRMGLTMKARIVSEDETPSAMGLVADTFRKREDVITGSGIFRFSAWGRERERHAEGLEHLIHSGGFALLLGVDIYSLSAMHFVEDALPEEIRARFQPGEEARRKYPEDRWLIEAWTPQAQPWYTIQREAYAQSMIRDLKIGEARCMLLEILPVVSLYRQALLTDPLGLYGLR